MAIYRCEVKSHSRRAGKNKVSAVAAIAYRTGSRLIDNKGQEHNYTKRHGVEHNQIITPYGAPAWASDRHSLWVAADKAEKRADAKFGREFIVALPHELSAAARAELAIDFTRLLVERFGFAADLAVHKPKTGDNHHAHIFCSTRMLTAEGFTSKTRELDDKRRSSELVSQIRTDWENLTNAALAKAGLDVRVDRRSHAELGDGLLPQASLTRYDAELERQGTPTINGNYNRKITELNAQVVEQRAEEVRQAQLKAEHEERMAREAQEATRIAVLEREAQEVKRRQAEQAKIARIDDLVAKERDLRRKFMDVAYRTIAAEEKITSNPNSKYDEGDPLWEVKTTNAPAEFAAYAEWTTVTRELEKLGGLRELQAEQSAKQGFFSSLFGKQEPKKPETFNECLDFANSRRPQIKGWLQDVRDEKELNAKHDAERSRQNALDRERLAAREEAERLRLEENARIRAENVAKRDTPSTPAPNPQPKRRNDDIDFGF